MKKKPKKVLKTNYTKKSDFASFGTSSSIKKEPTPQVAQAWDMTYEPSTNQLVRLNNILKWLYLNHGRYPVSETWRKEFVDMLIKELIS